MAVSGTRREALDALAGELGGAPVLPCDLSNKDSVEALVPDAEKALGQLESWWPMPASPRTACLLRSRTRTGTGPRRQSDVDLPARARGGEGDDARRFGRIIGITSVVGVTGNPGQANYTATKAGMIGMFKSIGKEYAKRGVTANCVAPGFIATPMTEKLNDKQREAILQMVPAGRLGAVPMSRRRWFISPPTRRPTSPARPCT